MFDSVVQPFLEPAATDPQERERSQSKQVRLGGLEAVLRMPLDVFAREGQILEVRVPWHDETLLFVPGERDVAALAAESVSRGRIWTARELMAIISITTQGRMVTVAKAKLAVAGEVASVIPRVSAVQPSPPTGPRSIR